MLYDCTLMEKKKKSKKKKCLKGLVSEDTSTSKIVNVPKHC